MEPFSEYKVEIVSCPDKYFSSYRFLGNLSVEITTSRLPLNVAFSLAVQHCCCGNVSKKYWSIRIALVITVKKEELWPTTQQLKGAKILCLLRQCFK